MLLVLVLAQVTLNLQVPYTNIVSPEYLLGSYHASLHIIGSFMPRYHYHRCCN